MLGYPNLYIHHLFSRRGEGVGTLGEGGKKLILTLEIQLPGHGFIKSGDEQNWASLSSKSALLHNLFMFGRTPNVFSRHFLTDEP